ncbi:hypothetical protein JOL62DRAFT_236327 [Phyllosticta paracitricarpa]|uniref:Uncharacterized protein n=1 Tax=Phyllosticta paracitricarpa TaxID=2016321 RepID=A0ABR1NI36_9PEZI
MICHEPTLPLCTSPFLPQGGRLATVTGLVLHVLDAQTCKTCRYSRPQAAATMFHLRRPMPFKSLLCPPSDFLNHRQPCVHPSRQHVAATPRPASFIRHCAGPGAQQPIPCPAAEAKTKRRWSHMDCILSCYEEMARARDCGYAWIRLDR